MQLALAITEDGHRGGQVCTQRFKLPCVEVTYPFAGGVRDGDRGMELYGRKERVGETKVGREHREVELYGRMERVGERKFGRERSRRSLCGWLTEYDNAEEQRATSEIA